MTSPSFVKEVAEASGLSQKSVKEIAGVFENIIKQTLERGESFKFADVNYSVKDVPAHSGRNPATGETVDVPASKKVVIKPASGLKMLLK